VITDGGDQPNVVPQNAKVWYYFRQLDYASIMNLWKIGDRMAEGATLMTDTTVTSRVLGTAWPGHFSKPIADVVKANIEAVGLPEWSNDDQTLAKALQKELGVEQEGLPTKLDNQANRDQEPDPRTRLGGGSDDIGDVSWNVPTVVLRFPSNIPGLPGHNWANAIAMATPIAHKGVIAGAKVEAMSILDLLTNPDLISSAWDYFKNIQTKNETYKPLIRTQDKPAIWLNEKIMQEYRPRMKDFYYNPEKYDTYLEQLGIKYPTIK
jgi:aminobenzoyl-glutamate utilization protein B